MGGALSEAQEVELATELLEMANEEELEQFLGGLFKKVVEGVGSFVRSPIGKALGGVLKSVAKKALPIVGGALGSFVAPGIGTAIGAKLGSMASGLFEMAGRDAAGAGAVRSGTSRRRPGGVFRAATRRRHGRAPTVNPRTVARAAVARAARTYAPGVYRAMLPP